MAHTSEVPPVKLFVVTLHSPSAPLKNAISEMKDKWGDTDFESEDFPFEVTDYYKVEMGEGLQRRFYSFRNLIAPEQIVDAKLFTNALEEKYRSPAGRTLNLDPGCLDFYKVMLASAKFGGQKIHIRSGIYADMTLVMYKGKWESFAWGFPDFKSGTYDSVLSRIRELYKVQVRATE